MSAKKFFLNNIGLKLIALVLAVIAWVYIVGELDNGTPEERAAITRLLPYRMTAKFLPVRINMIGELERGYSVDEGGIVCEPGGIMVIGPGSLLERVSFVKTELIDLTGYNRTLTKQVRLLPLAKGLSIKEKFVNITIPIEKAKK